jgi:hypothetical protein
MHRKSGCHSDRKDDVIPNAGEGRVGNLLLARYEECSSPGSKLKARNFHP